MKILNVYYSMTFYKHNDKYYCNGAFGRYLDQLATKYDQLTVCVPVCHTSEVRALDYEIRAENILLQELPDYKNVLGSIKYILPSIKKLLVYSRDWKHIYIRWPSPYSYFVYLLGKYKNIPMCIHMVGDTKSIIAKGSKYTGIVKQCALLLAGQQEWCAKRIMKKAQVIVNGSGLRRLYQNKPHKVKEIRTSTFSEKEIVIRFDACAKKTIKILYVGYLRHEKGLKYLVEAFYQLHKVYPGKFYLNLVGDGEERRPLEQMVSDLGIADYVQFTGYVPLGHTLFKLYAESDLFVLPSISEGTPRVLIEAMANGVPIVATNAGGIPFTIKNMENGIIIDTESSDQIVTAITKIVDDPILKEHLVRNGYEFARLNTLESHVEEVYSILEKQ